MQTEFWSENPKERHRLGSLGVGLLQFSIKRRILRYDVMDWVHLAHDRIQCWAVVNTVRNLLFPWQEGCCLTGWVNIRFWRSAPPRGVGLVIRTEMNSGKEWDPPESKYSYRELQRRGKTCYWAQFSDSESGYSLYWKYPIQLVVGIPAVLNIS
jgi:hypothetical protein